MKASQAQQALKSSRRGYTSTSINQTCWHIFHIRNIPPLSFSSMLPTGRSKLKSKFLSWSCQVGFLAMTYRARYHYCSERCKGRKLRGACKTLPSCRVVYLFSYWSCLSLRNNDCFIKFLKSPMLHCALTFVMLKISDLSLCNLSPKLLWWYFSCTVLLLLSLCCYSHALSFLNSDIRFLRGDDCPGIKIAPSPLLFPLPGCLNFGLVMYLISIMH